MKQLTINIQHKILPICILMFSIIACNQRNDNSLTIAVAANAQYFINDIAQQYENATGNHIQVIVGSSGKLSAQIEQGAPFDIFISADLKYPNTLYQHGLSKSPPLVYAIGSLVLFTADPEILLEMDSLVSERISHIAIANPKNAPYGKASLEVLQKLPIFKDIEGKLVMGESIGQTTQFVTSGAAEIGLTAKSIVLAVSDKNIKWIPIEDRSHSLLEQGLIILTDDVQQSKQAIAFIDFLQSSKGKDTLLKYGYALP